MSHQNVKTERKGRHQASMKTALASKSLRKLHINYIIIANQLVLLSGRMACRPERRPLKTCFGLGMLASNAAYVRSSQEQNNRLCPLRRFELSCR
jgi:hypothetical protein